MKTTGRAFRALAVGVLAALLAGGCSGEKKPREAGRHYDDDKDFSIRFPSDWETQTGDAGVEVMSLSPLDGAGDSFRENVNVVTERLPSRMSLKAYGDASVKNLQKMLSNCSVEEHTTTRIGGEEAGRIVYMHRMQGYDIKVLAYYLVDGRQACVITSTATKQSYARFEAQFEAIAKTFRLE